MQSRREHIEQSAFTRQRPEWQWGSIEQLPLRRTWLDIGIECAIGVIAGLVILLWVL